MLAEIGAVDGVQVGVEIQDASHFTDQVATWAASREHWEASES